MYWKIPYINFARQFKKQQKEYIREFTKVMTKGDFAKK